MSGKCPGDVRVRASPVRPQEFQVAAPRRRRHPTPAPLLLIYGFLGLIAAGTALLMLPISTRDGSVPPLIDALFTATSASTVTGLVVVDTGTHWSAFGHVVLLGLMQAGGFGIMAGSTLLLLLLVRRGTRLRERVLVQETVGTPSLSSAGTIVRRVAIFTVVCEVIGAVVLSGAFLARGSGGDPLGSIWWGVFHSVSAFNNAGFDLTGDFRSLAGFADDWLVLLTVGTLLTLGGLGYAIVADVFGRRRWVRLALETKIVLATSSVLLVGGALLIGAIEWSNPQTLGAYPEASRPLNALFESATLRTAGFSVLPTAGLEEASLFLAMALMFIGGASGSTAGGIKVNTFSILLIAIVSTVRGEPSATAFGRRVKHELVYRALSVALIALVALFLVGFLLTLTTDVGFVDILFESVSALGTVGASTGITPQTDAIARIVLIGAMFAGRLGPLTLVLALAARSRPVSQRPAVESIRIG
ncbi:MAG: Trk family potassium uptake protein [Chloroflexi bacterium]|nr:Trk family potassium uptake protein [Chloroflexota bacterium]